jgi:hypothetical protein
VVHHSLRARSALFGDRASDHGGVGLAMFRGEPGPRTGVAQIADQVVLLLSQAGMKGDTTRFVRPRRAAVGWQLAENPAERG